MSEFIQAIPGLLVLSFMIWLYVKLWRLSGSVGMEELSRFLMMMWSVTAPVVGLIWALYLIRRKKAMTA